MPHRLFGDGRYSGSAIDNGCKYGAVGCGTYRGGSFGSVCLVDGSCVSIHIHNNNKTKNNPLQLPFAFISRTIDCETLALLGQIKKKKVRRRREFRRNEQQWRATYTLRFDLFNSFWFRDVSILLPLLSICFHHLGGKTRELNME